MVVSKQELDALVDFYDSLRGSEKGFLFKDPSDYILYPRLTLSGYGSYTQGVIKKGEQKNWLTKAYSLKVGGYWHTFNRLITRPDPGLLINGVAGSAIAGTGEVNIAASPYSATVEGTFKVPVRFANESLKITPLSLDPCVGYASVSGVILEEVREGFSADYVNFRQPTIE